MKKHYIAIIVLLLTITSTAFAQNQANNLISSNNNLVKLDPSSIDPKISNMLNFYDKQIYFTQNRGQWPDSVLYKADFPLGQALVTAKGMIVGTYDAKAYAAHNDQYERKERARQAGLGFNEAEVKVPGHGWLMNFVGHNSNMTIESKTKHNEYFNYFVGRDASKYASNAANYQEIWYKNVYNNVDVRYYPSATGTLEYDIVCNPGFNKNDLAIQLQGIPSMQIKQNGHLILNTSVGDMEFPAPVAYQKINGVKTMVSAKYVIKNNVLHFEIGNYDASQPLIIDPIALRWATWMTNNSTAANHNHCIWVDQNTGYIYVIARVASSGLITENAIQNTYNGGKTGGDENEIGEYIEPDTIGNPGERVWQTYLGAAGESNPYALEQAANGDLIFTGYTQSTDYPLLGGTQYSGSSINDAASSSSEKIFITKINTAGTSFKSAVIGGNGNDAPFDLRTTSTSDVLVCGNTTSTNLATVFPGSGATNSSSSNGQDVIVFRVNNDLSAITWMKNYGGTGSDGATIMNTNTVNGDIFIAGTTTSTNFPVSSNARQSTAGGSTNSFIQKLNSKGNIVWSTYFNAASSKSAQILCMELNTTASSLYFGGITTGLASTNISSSKVIQSSISGTTDFFVGKIDTNQTFDAATYLGAGSEVNMMGLNIDLNNDVYILGYTASTKFPVTANALQSTNMASSGNDNETFTKIRTDLDSLDFSTYYGGSVDDYDPVGERGIKFFNCRIFTVFTSESNNVPLTQGAITTTKLSSSSIYEPGIVVWANPPDLSNNTITTNQQICKGSTPSGFTGSVPSYVLPNINRNGTISSYPVTLNSATTYQWQYSTDSVNWNNVAGGTTQNLSSAQIGPLYKTTYFRRIIGGDACVIAGAAEQTVTVKIMTVSGTVTNVSCLNGNNGTATANPINGTTPYTYSWNTTPVQTTKTASNLTAGTYSVIVTDATGCKDTMSFIITQPTTALSGTTSSTQATCTSNNGTASVIAGGGTGAYTYSWNTTPVQTTATATGLAGGTYTITVTDANGCTFTSSATVSQSSPIVATASVVNNVSCAGGTNGVATVNATGGSGTYTYSWNTIPVQTTQTASNLTAGTYTVTVTDHNGCTNSSSVTISQPQLPVTASITSQTNVLCYGNNTGAATVSANGGTGAYTYSWNSNPVQTSATASNLNAGTYTVTVTDFNGCSTTATVTITQPVASVNASISAHTNVLCYGNNTGSATVSVTGGTGTYTYSWDTSPVQTTATATGLLAGTYTVTVNDHNGCQTTATVSISQPLAVLSASISTHTNVSCYGNNSGSATASVTGGTAAYTYSWNTIPAQTSATATGLTAGTYTVTVTDANSCSTTANVTISQPAAALNASISAHINVSCYGNNTGSATASVNGGTGSYTYSWNTAPAQTSATATGLTAGTYTVTVTDANGCSTTANVTISQPAAALNASISAHINVSCYGNNTGSATASVNGGTGSYTYSWNTTPAQTSATATGLTAGTYTVTVTDANGCSTSASVTISQPQAAISASIKSQTNVSCFGGSGSAVVTATGGVKAYTYSWNTTPVQTTDSAINLSAGTYTVTVTDANGCSTTATVTISQPVGALSASITSQTSVLCYGGNNASATVTASAGTPAYTYSWNTVPVQTTATASGLTAGTYTVIVTDAAGCIASASVTIAQPQAALTASISSQIPVSCYGNSNGSATASVDGGTPSYTYSWNTTPVQTTATATGLAAGTYTVIITDANGCSTTTSVTISQPQAALNASISSQVPVSCFGNNNGSATVSVTGGTQSYTYSWSTEPMQNTATATGLTAGNYTVYITDANGCSTSANVTISQPQAALNASISSQIPVSCYGNSNGSATVSVTGGTPSYTYSWNTTPAQTTATATGLATGTYSVTITDANGCSTTASVTISQPQAALNASISSQIPVSCFGTNNGSATVSVIGGTTPYTYSWSTEPMQTTATATGLMAGSYTVYITDANGCSTTATVTISQPQAALNATISSQIPVSCYGTNSGSATTSVTGGTTPYTYSWNTQPAQTSATATGLTAGTYTVSITDSNGCTTSASVTISQPQAALNATISSQVNVSCYGGNGSATVSVTGGTPSYTYSWNTTPAQTTATATGLAAGTYTVVVIDSNGCSTMASVTITQPVGALNASITAQSNVFCYGNSNGTATVTASAGTLPYTYSWNTAPAQTTATATGLSTGIYTVTVTDSGGCITTATVAITQPQAALNATISSQIPVSCYGNNNGSATASVTGGTPSYTYSWNTTPAQTTATATGLTAGTYTVSIIDSNGCTTSASVTISQPQAALNATISSQIPVSCYGTNSGSATASVTGGTNPYTYSWNTQPAQTTATATGLMAGTYMVSITDSNGCSTSASVTISQPQAALSASITSQVNVSCYGGNGSATASVAGGTPSYTYSWNTTPAQTTATATGLAAGTYTVTIIDSNGCSTMASVTITQPVGALNASITAQADVLCYGSNTGSATVTATAGTQPYTYSWNTAPTQTTATATGLTAGSYVATVMDSGGCITSVMVNILQPQAALNASLTATSSTVCSSSPSTITATVTGGTGNYTYSWSPGGATTDTLTVNPTVTTTYTVTINDANNCSTTGTITINVNQLPAVSVTTNSPAICNGTSDTLTASGAINYTWTPSTSLSSSTGSPVVATPTATVTYTVTGTDGNGCSNTATATVTVKALPTVSLSGLNPSYCSNSTYVKLTGIPPAPPPQGQYSGTTLTQSGLQGVFHPDSAGVGGPYTITYTYKDTNGCSNSASLPVTILAAPNVAVSPDSPAVCSGIPVTLSATGANSYSWSPSTGLSATTGSSVISSASNTTIYTVIGSDTDGCSSTVSATVTINVLPQVAVSPANPNICLGNSVNLIVSGSGTSYNWSPSSGLSCSTCGSTIANPTSTTQYIVDVSNGKCSVNDTITVGVYSVTVKAGPDQHILYGQTAQLTASGADFYTWTPANSLNNDSISDPIASPTITTTYTVTGRDSLGCTSTDTVVVYVSNPCEALNLPSAFTPAGNTNRHFHVLNIGGVTLQEFRVYNRWGQMMYETNNINDEGWDGTFDGKAQPMGTYVYYAEVLCEGKTVFIKGNVELLR